MAQNKFICSDGKHIEFDACLKKCRLNKRCQHIAFLRQAAQQRVWKGTPSVTQLQNPTLQAYLEITNDYAAEPGDNVYAILGTAVHTLLEQDMDRMTHTDGWSGLPDWYEDGELNDFKVSGFYTQQGTINKWKQQVNAYRLLLEENGHEVTKMRIFHICRDASKARGQVTTKWHEVKRIPDEEVKAYFKRKKALLMTALDLGVEPPCCSDEDRWYNGKTRVYTKCKFYCPVNYLCKHNKEAK